MAMSGGSDKKCLFIHHHDGIPIPVDVELSSDATADSPAAAAATTSSDATTDSPATAAATTSSDATADSPAAAAATTSSDATFDSPAAAAATTSSDGTGSGSSSEPRINFNEQPAEFLMYIYKVKRCSKFWSHDWIECPYAHPGEKARRRDPIKFLYSAIACSEFRHRGECQWGLNCGYAHGVFEFWLHPTRFRTRLCDAGDACTRRVCFFAHTLEQLRLVAIRSNFWQVFQAVINGFDGNGLVGSSSYSSFQDEENGNYLVGGDEEYCDFAHLDLVESLLLDAAKGEGGRGEGLLTREGEGEGDRGEGQVTEEGEGEGGRGEGLLTREGEGEGDRGKGQVTEVGEGEGGRAAAWGVKL